MRRREFIAALGSAAALSAVASAQQSALPVVGFVSGGTADALRDYAAAYRKGLGEAGYIDGRNVTVEYHWLEGQYDRLARISHTNRGIGAPNQRELLCHNDFTQVRGAPDADRV